jgi:hypothetical protein
LLGLTPKFQFIRRSAYAFARSVGRSEDTLLSISALLWVDEQYHTKTSLAEALGDSYLMHHNPMFRITRHAILEKGFLLISDDSDLARSYSGAPLLVLDDLYQKRQIPFRSNRSALKSLLERAPDIKVSEKVLLGIVSRNVIFHEALHCCGLPIAEELLQPVPFEDEASRFVVTSSLVESFANTVERLAFSFPEVPLHSLFLKMHSYVSFDAYTCALLRDLVAHFGIRLVFTMGICITCQLNLYSCNPSQKTLTALAETIFKEFRLNIADKRFITETASRIWGLSRSFRDDTSAFFYRSHGCQQEYERIAHDEPFTFPCTCEAVASCADQFVERFLPSDFPSHPQLLGALHG